MMLMKYTAGAVFVLGLLMQPTYAGRRSSNAPPQQTNTVRSRPSRPIHSAPGPSAARSRSYSSAPGQSTSAARSHSSSHSSAPGQSTRSRSPSGRNGAKRGRARGMRRASSEPGRRDTRRTSSAEYEKRKALYLESDAKQDLDNTKRIEQNGWVQTQKEEMFDLRPKHKLNREIAQMKEALAHQRAMNALPAKDREIREHLTKNKHLTSKQLEKQEKDIVFMKVFHKKMHNGNMNALKARVAERPGLLKRACGVVSDTISGACEAVQDAGAAAAGLVCKGLGCFPDC